MFSVVTTVAVVVVGWAVTILVVVVEFLIQFTTQMQMSIAGTKHTQHKKTMIVPTMMATTAPVDKSEIKIQ